MALKEFQGTPQSDTEKVNFSEYADLLKSRVPGATDFNLISEFGRSLFTKYAFSISKVETVKDWGDRITALTHFGSNQVNSHSDSSANQKSVIQLSVFARSLST